MKRNNIREIFLAFELGKISEEEAIQELEDLRIKRHDFWERFLPSLI